MNKKKLELIRKKIDLIDLQLLRLIGKRTNLVKRVIKIKKFKKQIVDRKRISIVMRNIKKNSIKKKIDSNITKNIWNAIIKSFIDFEKRNF